MPAQETEAELLAQAVAGDHVALGSLLLAHHPRWVADLRRRLPRQALSTLSAEDVLQDTYVAVFQRIGRFQPRGPEAFHRWVGRIAEHRLLDLLKRERAAKRGGRHVRLTDGTGDESLAVRWLELLAVHEHTPSRSAARREIVLAVERALAELKREYRDALRLRYIEGLTVAEVAARLGRTPGAVHMLLQRGLQRLEALLGESSRFRLH